MKQRFLVTGGAGFIGSHSVEALLREGHDVVVLDDLSTGKRENLAAAAEFVAGDIRDEALIGRLAQGVDGILHLAALVSVPRSVEAPLESLSRNVAGTLAVLEAARRCDVHRVVLASSAAVYGRMQPPLGEDIPAAPLSPYGLEKAACETYARLYHELHGVQTVALRYFNVYGPRQDPASPYSGVLSILADRALRGETFVVHGDGTQSRDFVHVRDIAEANRLALLTPDIGHAVLNLGTGSATAIRDLVRVMADLVPGMPAVTHGPARAGDVPASRALVAKALEILGWQARVPMREGLAELVSGTRPG